MRRVSPAFDHPRDSAATTPLQTASSTDLASLTDLLGITVGVRGALHLLAQLPDVHVLPAADPLHLGEKLGRGLGRVHVGGNVGVESGALLEDADAVVVRADGVMGVVERLGNLLVGVY